MISVWGRGWAQRPSLSLSTKGTASPVHRCIHVFLGLLYHCVCLDLALIQHAL